MGCGCGSDCGCGNSTEQSSCCSSQDSCCDTGKTSKEQMFELFLCMADEAWMKALKQKMVETYLKENGKDLEKMAKFFNEAAGLKYMNPEEFMKKKPELLKQFSGSEKKDKKK